MQAFLSVPIGFARHKIVRMRRVSQRGITLLELCIGLALVAVLAGLAAPGFQASLRAGAIRTAAYELMAGVQQARADSIVESRAGVLCASDPAGRCLSADAPSHAWSAFLEAGGPLDAYTHVLPRGIVLRANRASIRFSPVSLAASTATLTICDEQGIARGRAIVISQNGRARFAAPGDAECR